MLVKTPLCTLALYGEGERVNLIPKQKKEHVEGEEGEIVLGVSLNLPLVGGRAIDTGVLFPRDM